MSLADAIDLAAAGLPCFPCGDSKAPLVRSGFLAATCDLALVRRWWRRWPHALPAVPTGEPSRLWILDLDLDRETGETIGENAVTELGIDHPAYVVRTRSGGAHWVYRWREGLPRNTAGRLPCVDTRGAGGYIVAWNPIALISAKLDPGQPFPPAELLSALAPPVRPTTFTAFAPPASASRWAAAALAGELRQVAAAPVGRRNYQLNRSSFRLGQLAAGRLLDLGEITAALTEAALTAGLTEREATATIASGLAAGARYPRQNTVSTRPDQAANPRGHQAWTRAR